MAKIITILFFIVSPVLAQEYDAPRLDSVITDEILVESNRLKMKNSDAPNKVQVLDKQYIRSLNGDRLGDLLLQSDAVFVKDYGFNSGSKTISLNSTQSEHTLVLLNGVRLNSRQNAQVDLSLYDLNNVKRIEISKGGSSALYGSEAIGGVINIVTNGTLLKNSFGFMIKTGIGSYGLTKLFGSFSQNFELGPEKDISYGLSYSDEQAKNNFEYGIKSGQKETLVRRENSDFRSNCFNLNVSYNPDNKSSFSFFTNYVKFNRGVPGVDLGYAAGTARQEDRNVITALSYKRELSNDLFMNSSLSYNYGLQKYYDPSTYNLSVVINSFYKLHGVSAFNSVNYNPSEKFNFEAGSELNFDDIESNETEKGKLFQGAFYSAFKISLKSFSGLKVSLYPAIRYDYFSNIRDHNVVTGKLGANIQPFGKTEFHIKASVGNNFSAPTFNELYWKDIGNKNLRPERSISFDAGLYYKFKMAGDNELELSYFNVNTTDRIMWTPVSGSIWRPLNIGKVKSEGVDISLKSHFEVTNKLDLAFGFNYTYSNALKKNEDFAGDPSYNKQLIYLPKEMVKSSILLNYYLTTSKILKFVSFSLFCSFNTRRFTNFENTQFIPRFGVLDGNIGLGARVIGIDAGLRFMVNNIMNENYSVLPGYPMPVRNYRFELNIKY